MAFKNNSKGLTNSFNVATGVPTKIRTGYTLEDLKSLCKQMPANKECGRSAQILLCVHPT